MTERALPTVAPQADSASQGREQEAGDLERRLGRLLPRVFPLVVVASALGAFVALDLGAALLVLAGGVLLGAIALLWASLRTLTGDAPITIDEALALGHPSAAIEQKRAVLQALKDLEYERSVGKIDETDYDELSRRYRAEAKRLLRTLDEDLGPMRARAEAYAAERLGGRKSFVSTPRGRVCEACSTTNDDDARFCKGCGATLAGATTTKGGDDRATA